MSILIKDMEMPRNCYDCELIDIVKDCPHYNIPNDAYCQIPWLRKRRHENCPLVPVPPHGRLIDADALKQRAERGMDEHGRPCMLIKLGYVNTMPTIIPADPAEEGEG